VDIGEKWKVAKHFFFQAEDGIRVLIVTGVQTCALPIYEEDPTFHHEYSGELGQTLIRGLGERHLEIVVGRLARKFGVHAVIGKRSEERRVGKECRCRWSAEQ